MKKLDFNAQMTSCRLCPRNCHADRSQGHTGICGQTAELRVARAALHMWEEPCISGIRGSGAVFFSGCALHCVFCQNYNIAKGSAGKVIAVERLAEIFLELQEQGANNINLVTAGHFVPQVIQALDKARKKGLSLPVVYNTSAYEEVDNLRRMEGYVDIYLPDLKYVDKELARKYSHAPDYFEKASAAIEEMVRQIGKMEFMAEKNNDGTAENDRDSERMGVEEYQHRSAQGESILMTRGVIVRHLLLPGCAWDSKQALGYLLEKYGERIFISIMNQYTPLPQVSSYPELSRKVTASEYEEVVGFAVEHGIEYGFVQEEGTAEESFIPEFDENGV